MPVEVYHFNPSGITWGQPKLPKTHNKPKKIRVSDKLKNLLQARKLKKTTNTQSLQVLPCSKILTRKGSPRRRNLFRDTSEDRKSQNNLNENNDLVSIGVLQPHEAKDPYNEYYTTPTKPIARNPTTHSPQKSLNLLKQTNSVENKGSKGTSHHCPYISFVSHSLT